MDKTKFFIDFDDTLFDRNGFKNGLFDVVRSFGLSEEELETSYRAVYGDGYQGIWAQLDYIHENIKPIDLKIAYKKVDDFLLTSEKFLFDQTVSLLRAIDRKLFEVNLLTVGGLEFQKMKVESCRIDKFFDKIIYTMDNKAIELKKWVSMDETFVLIDDKTRELSAVAAAFPRALVYRADPSNMKKFINPLILEPKEKFDEN